MLVIAFTHYRKIRQSLGVPGYYLSTPGKSMTTFQRTTTEVSSKSKEIW
jgi:hypothetical protein